MKRRFSWLLWTGFLVVVVALVSYVPVFARFPSTRDFPWVNLLLFAAGLGLIAAGVRRAYAAPDRYRGRVLGAVIGGVGVLVLGFFLVAVFHLARQLPESKGAPQVGQRAPDFALPDQDGKVVTLSDLASGGGRGAVLIFYRGFW